MSDERLSHSQGEDPGPFPGQTRRGKICGNNTRYKRLKRRYQIILSEGCNFSVNLSIFLQLGVKAVTVEDLVQAQKEIMAHNMQLKEQTKQLERDMAELKDQSRLLVSPSHVLQKPSVLFCRLWILQMFAL